MIVRASIYMDPASVRALACVCRFHEIAKIMTDSYVEEHRSRTRLDTTVEVPATRCHHEDGKMAPMMELVVLMRTNAPIIITIVIK